MRLHSTTTDEDLLRLVRTGDESAFTTLYRRRQGAIYRFALHMSGSQSIAEDVTQEVFIALMRDSERYDPARGPLSAYLYGIARNHVLRHLERDRCLVSIAEQMEEGEAAVPESLIIEGDLLGDLTRNEMIEAVRQSVLALPAHYREVVVLCDLHEMSYEEAAAALDCAVGTVRSRLHRARALLVDKLRDVREAGPVSNGKSLTRCIA
ncbi:MAG TPA: RNA polymerase sigma factor [Blastocatellia bacterium]|nr:RNA polymerase sigma factor [Blastocatellia bacterium]